MASQTGPKASRNESEAAGPELNGRDADEFGDGNPNTLDSVTYILAMLKPLVEAASAQELQMLTYLLEMAVLEASELEFKLKSGTSLPASQPVTPPSGPRG